MAYFVANDVANDVLVRWADGKTMFPAVDSAGLHNAVRMGG
ncbi:hypothetical protein [Streptomyces noursei]